MKKTSFSCAFLLCVLFMQAQVSNADQPDQDSVRLTETQML